MKRIIICLFVLMAVETMADFKMPKKVYRLDELEKAQAEATSEKKAISFIITQEKTSCGICAARSLEAAKTLGRKTIVVYINSATELEKTPKLVFESLISPEAGKYIPKVVILNVDLTEVYAIVAIPEGSDNKEYVKVLKEALKELPDPKDTKNVSK